MTKSSNAAALVSWDLEHWPADVYPHSESRARYLVRAYRDELIRAGALTRVGRELVVMGDGYARFLKERTVNVPGFAAGQSTTSNSMQTGKLPDANRKTR